MEYVLNNHGSFALGLFTLGGGIVGIKSGLWGLGLFFLLGIAGCAALGLWENRSWLLEAPRERYALLSALPAATLLAIQQKTARIWHH